MVDQNGQWQDLNEPAPPLPQPYVADGGGGGGSGGGGGGGGGPKTPDPMAEKARQLRDEWRALPPGKDKDAAYKRYIEFSNSQGRNP